MRHHPLRRILLLLVLTLLLIPGAVMAGTHPVYLSDARIEILRDRVNNRLEPNYTAWLELLKGADAALVASPPLVPETLRSFSPYKDPKHHEADKGSNTFSRDALASFRLALAYRITGEERYAVGAVRLIRAWSDGLKVIEAKHQNTSLNVSVFMPCFIIAADLLSRSPSFTPADRTAFNGFLRNVVLASDSAGLCMKRTNNWANFGTLLAMTAGSYLDDRNLFDRGVARWKQLVEMQMDADGTLREEVSRPGGSDKSPGAMGLWYSNFSLFPATLAAEVARVNGVDLYGYTTPSGKSLRLAYVRLLPWIKDPRSFPYYKGSGDPAKLTGIFLIPYFEMLVPRWPEPGAADILRSHRPVRTNHCIPDETFTHGDLLSP